MERWYGEILWMVCSIFNNISRNVIRKKITILKHHSHAICMIAPFSKYVTCTQKILVAPLSIICLLVHYNPRTIWLKFAVKVRNKVTINSH